LLASLSVPALVASALTRAMAATPPIPISQPSRNAGPFDLARAEKSIRMTAMIGTGLSATPIARGRSWPSACPTQRIL